MLLFVFLCLYVRMCTIICVCCLVALYCVMFFLCVRVTLLLALNLFVCFVGFLMCDVLWCVFVFLLLFSVPVCICGFIS